MLSVGGGVLIASVPTPDFIRTTITDLSTFESRYFVTGFRPQRRPTGTPDAPILKQREDPILHGNAIRHHAFTRLEQRPFGARYVRRHKNSRQFTKVIQPTQFQGVITIAPQMR